MGLEGASGKQTPQPKLWSIPLWPGPQPWSWGEWRVLLAGHRQMGKLTFGAKQKVAVASGCVDIPDSRCLGWAGRSSQGWDPDPPPRCPRPLTDAAVRTREARRTLAAEPVDAINADAAIVAAGERQISGRPHSRPSPPGQPVSRTTTHQGRGLQSLVSVFEKREREVGMASTTLRPRAQPGGPQTRRVGGLCTVHTSPP